MFKPTKNMHKVGYAPTTGKRVAKPVQKVQSRLTPRPTQKVQSKLTPRPKQFKTQTSTVPAQKPSLIRPAFQQIKTMSIGERVVRATQTGHRATNGKPPHKGVALSL